MFISIYLKKFKYLILRCCEEQLNILAYADDIALIGKNEIELRKL
jgi:hypothetical protein